MKTKSELIALQNRGAQYVIIVKYAHGNLQRGDFVSWHKSHEAACRACDQFSSVTDISDAIFYASE